MQSPKEIIENIRKTRFGIGLNIKDIPEDIRAHIEDSKNLRSAAARLITDIYTEKPHFILELIQNAEDNNYNEHVKPMVRFIIQRDKLIIQNNEKGFNVENVRALCGIGQSSKQKSMGYIGEKGIGFKSVFMVTNEPYIYSNGFQFKFKYDEKNPDSIMIPEWVDYVPDYIIKEQTNIILPLKKEIRDGLIKLDKIDPCLLLFLCKLRYIEIDNKIQGKLDKIERYDTEGKVEIIHPRGKDFWKIVKNSLKIPNYVNDEKRKDIVETEIVLAFPLRSDGSADTSKKQNIFAYLPIRSFGFKFIIQADFLMPPSRQDIHKDESDKSWNKWLRDNIASLFLKAVEEFKQDEKLQTTYYNYIPLKDEITDEFFLPVVKGIQNKLFEAQCILTESKSWLKPTEVFRADNDIRNLIQNDDLKRFFDKEYISSEIKANKQILDALGVPEFGFNQLAQCLQKEEWLNSQSDEWFISLYVYLNKQGLKKEQREFLKQLKIFRLESNELASISEKPIFSPLNNNSDYGFENELRVLKKTIFETKQKEIKVHLREFLTDIGIQNASPYEIIEHHILPTYESGEWKKKNQNTLKGYISYIKENIEIYEKEKDKQLNAYKKLGGLKEDPFRRLKESLYIRINKTVNGIDYYDHPQNIYLPKIYGNENDLEALFEGIENISFVHEEYIAYTTRLDSQNKKDSKENNADIVKEREAETKEWREFFIKLGINDGLKLKKSDKSYLTKEDKQRLRGQLNCESEEEVDYELIPLQQILERIDEKKAQILVNIFEKKWGELSRYTNLKYKYKLYFSKTQKKFLVSSWLYLLKTNFWLPTSKSGFARPNEVFLDKPEIKELLGDAVPYLNVDVKNENFIKALGINSAVNVKGVLNTLKMLSTQMYTDKNIFKKLYVFLNENYEDNEVKIKTAFCENKIIYIPDATQKYFSSKEVLWKDVSDIFGENLIYLEKNYSELKAFFVDKLGIREKPTPKDYANVLIELSKKEMIEQKDDKIILRIYNELNNYLNLEDNEHLISEEDWWKDFINRPIFWVDKNKFWKNNRNLFVNDNPELYELFKDKPDIAFLKLPENYYPKIKHFIEAAGLQYITKVVKIELFDTGEKIELTKNTELIHSLVPYILRYLYKLEHDTYNKFKKVGNLARLKNLKCYSIEKLQVKYTLNGHSAFSQRNAILHNGDLYIQNGNSGDTDSLALELSKLFGEIRGFDNFLISLFDKKTDKNIENLLRRIGIQNLPEEEQELLGIEVKKHEDHGTYKEEDITGGNKSTITSKFLGSVVSEKPEVLNISGDISEQVKSRKKGWKPQYSVAEVQSIVEQINVLGIDELGIQDKKTILDGSEYSQISLEETEFNTLTMEDKKAIGTWGEEYVFEYLKDKLRRKYPEGTIKDNEDSFTIIYGEQKYIKVHWLNKNCDNGVGYDIKVIEDDKEEFIEVKSTKTNSKEWFDISGTQWKFIQEKGDKFHIYRVFNAGTREAKIVIISNPKKLLEEGTIAAHPVRIKI